MKARGRSGFSLVELMVALVFLGLMLSGMVRALTASLASWSQVNEALAAQRGARWALEPLGEDLRMLGRGRPFAVQRGAGPDSDDLTFALDPPWGGEDGRSILAAGPPRLVRYAVVTLDLEDPKRDRPERRIPCLARFETAPAGERVVPRRVLAENVAGFRVDFTPGPDGPVLVSVTLDIRSPASGRTLHRRILRVAPRNAGLGGAA
jgi:prepilin-type N-terminal cleavage/methylation domain-containing protein